MVREGLGSLAAFISFLLACSMAWPLAARLVSRRLSGRTRWRVLSWGGRAVDGELTRDRLGGPGGARWEGCGRVQTVTADRVPISAGPPGWVLRRCCCLLNVALVPIYRGSRRGTVRDVGHDEWSWAWAQVGGCRMGRSVRRPASWGRATQNRHCAKYLSGPCWQVVWQPIWEKGAVVGVG